MSLITLNSLNLISSTTPDIANWVTTADFAVGKSVQTSDSSKLVANSVHDANDTQLDS